MAHAVVDQYKMIEQRMAQELEGFYKQKLALLEKFKSYAYGKLHDSGKPFDLSYRAVNGDTKLTYKDIKLGEEFEFQSVSLSFDPQTERIIDGNSVRYASTKRSENLDENVDIDIKEGKNINQKPFNQTPFHLAGDVVTDLIVGKLEEKANGIVMAMFNGDLVFDDPEYKALISETAALEQEIDRLTVRLTAMQLANSEEEVELFEESKTR